MLKRTWKKNYHNDYYDVYKKITIRKRNKLSAAKKKKFDYKKFKLTNDYDCTSDEEEEIELKKTRLKKIIIRKLKKEKKVLINRDL